MSTVGFDAGTASAPGLYVNGNTNTGIFSPTTNELSVTANGAEVARFLDIASSTGYLTVTNSTSSAPLTLSTNSPGNGINITLPSNSSGAAGNLYLQAGNTISGGNNYYGGTVDLVAGYFPSQQGGLVSIYGGGSDNGPGGTVSINGGGASTVNSGNGGDVTIAGGVPGTGSYHGGNIVINGGDDNGGSSIPGKVTISGGRNVSGGQASNLILNGGYSFGGTAHGTITMNVANSLNLVTLQNPGTANSAIILSGGTVTFPSFADTSQPTTPVNGMLYYSTTQNKFVGYQNSAWTAIGGSTGTVTSVGVSSTGGTISVTGSPITSSGTINVDLPTSGVTAGTYNNLTVNNKGIVTSGSNTAYLTANQNITVSGDATGSGTTAIALTLANSGVTAGTYNNLTVNAKGLVTSGSNTAYLTANQNITLSGDVTGSGTTAITGTLAASGVTAGTYNNATITVDAKGRVTSASNGSSGSVPAIGAGEAYQTLQVDSTSSTYQLVGPINYANKNVIMGGDFSVNPWQRGTSFSIVANSSPYTADRFYYAVGPNGGVNTTQATGGPDGVGYHYQATVATAVTSPAASDYSFLSHRIEGSNLLRFCLGTANAKPMTLSFWVAASVAGTYSVALRNLGVSSYVTTYTVTTANTWQFVSLTIPGCTTGTWAPGTVIGMEIDWAVMMGSNYTTSSTNTWGAVGNLASTSQTNLMATSGNSFQIDRIQLELGSVATAFERLDAVTTLAKCQRYYQTIPEVFGYTAYANGPSYGAHSWFTLPVTMRTTPTITLSNQSYYNAYGMGVGFAYPYSVDVYCVSSSAGMAYGTASATLSADL